ncbi:hypothetical protein LJC08_01555 [Methanimicrococcus sp. OttesenSCG-928-J09]|nr:hypothetical protein [Methanimicrococcus sp. OttesenSCG-928-J09]
MPGTWSQVSVLQWEGGVCYRLESGFRFAVGGRCLLPIGVRFPFCSGREVFAAVWSQVSVTDWSQVSVLQWEGGV